MSDLQDTLDAIDQLAVHACGHCQRPLRPDGPSVDFCGPWCQEAWLRAKQEIIDLVGYDEPDDLPVHAFNLVELRSPETTPARPDWLEGGPVVPLRGNSPLAQLLAANCSLNITVDTSRLEAELERANEAIERFAQRARGITPDFVIFDEIHTWNLVGGPVMANAGWVRLWFESEPEPVACPEAPFGSDFDFEQTPAKSLPHEPPPAVLPAAPAQDWQSLIDSRSSSYRAPDRFRRPFGRSR